MRFVGFPVPQGLLVLDTLTGEVRLADPEHGERVVAAPRALAIDSPASVSAPPLRPGDVVITERPPAPPAREERAAPAGDDLPAGIDDVDREVVLTFPYPVARPYLDLLGERDPRLRCKLLVDTFTSVLKVWALVVASEYIRATEVRDAQVHRTLVRDLARPLISAWNLLLQRALPVLREAGVAPFAPELSRAYEALETKCRQRFLVTETYVDDTGAPQTRTKRLGKIQALIAYRNGLAHGFNQSARQAQRDLDTYLPLLKEVLREARFLARYPLWHVVEGPRGGESALGFRLMGARPSSEPTPLDAADLDPKISPLFLRNEASGEVLPLFAFFDVHEVEDGGLPGLGRDVFLFEGNTKGTVIYVSATGEHAEKASRFTHWQALLAAKAVDVEMLSADTLSLDALRAAAGRIADQAIEALVSGGKYLREASVDRPDLAAHLDTFTHGRFTALVLGGESGIGKSTLLARLVEQRRAAGDAVAFYRASALPTADVGGRLLRDLGLAGMYLEDLHTAAAPLFREGGRFLLVVDAINEFGGDVAELVRSLDQLVHQSAAHDWFRVIVSIREGAYNRLAADARFGARGLAPYLTVEEERGGVRVRTPVLHLGPLGRDHVEALYEAYRGYRQRDPDDPESPGLPRFRPTTPYADLAADGSTRALLRSPLMARLVLAAFHRRALPSDLRSDQAMRLYLEHVVIETERPGGGFPARRRFLAGIVRELDKLGSDAIPRDLLTASPVREVREAMLAMQRDSAYVQLVELGVLLEEWDGDTCMVRFAFDRLFEHLLAELHDPRVQAPADALALARRALAFRNLRGALDAILGRACEQGREVLLTELLDLGAGDADPAVRELVEEVATTLLVRLAREGDPAFARIIEGMPVDPSVTDVEVLDEVAARLARMGEVAPLRATIGVLEAEARALGHAEHIARACLRRAAQARAEGALPEALEALEEACTHAAAADARPLALRADLLRAKVRATQGALPEALALFESTHAALRARGLAAEAADARREQAILTARLGDTEAAITVAHDALALAREAADAFNEVRCLDQIGALLQRRGDPRAALGWFEQALAIAQREGHPHNIAHMLDRLGDHLRPTDTARARAHYEQALAIRERIADAAGIAETLMSLGQLVSRQGEKAAAEAHFRRALAMREAIGNPSGVASALASLALLLSDRGEMDEATALYTRAHALREALGDRTALSASHNSLGNLARKQGRLDEAEQHYRAAIAIDEQLGDRKGVGMLLNNLAIVIGQRGRPEEKEALYEQSLAIMEELGARDAIALRLNNLAIARYKRGDIEGATAYVERALALRTELGLREGIASTRQVAGSIRVAACDDARAADAYRESLAGYEALGNAAGRSGALTGLAGIALRAGDPDAAERMVREALVLDEKRRSPVGIATDERLLSSIALARGDVEEAVALARAALTRIEAVDDKEDVAAGLATCALALHAAGHAAEAREMLRRRLTMVRGMGSADPSGAPRPRDATVVPVGLAAYQLASVLLDDPASVDPEELGALSTAVEACANGFPVPSHRARAALLRARRYAREGATGPMESALGEAREALAAWGTVPQGVDSPVSALLDAAAHHRAGGDSAHADACATEARTWLGTAAHARRTEVMAWT